MKPCEEFSAEECETVKFYYTGFQCKLTNENKCELWSCNWMGPDEECGNFVPFDPLYKCVKSDSNDGCWTLLKDCEELSSDQCDLYNTEDILSKTKKKCKEKNGK